MSLSPQTSRPSALTCLGHPASGEIIELPRVCAMFDKPYIARYVRGADGLFRLLETAKFENSTGKRSVPKKRVNLSSSQKASDGPEERCSWCGVSGAPVNCGQCEMWVCSGQLRKQNGRDYFRCRASCGLCAYVEGFADGCEGWLGAAPVKRLSQAKGKSVATLSNPASRLRLKS
jgi:hypothetical protein